MEAFTHDLPHLFQQLGLPSDQSAIDKFVKSHKLPNEAVEMADAPFWNSAQAAFLRESIQEDSDWAEAADQLDALLRN